MDIGREFRAWVRTQSLASHKMVAADDNHLYVEANNLRAEINIYTIVDESEIVEYRITHRTDDPLFFLHFALDDMRRAKDLFQQMSEALAKQLSRKTTPILQCCTSALTTSMFASKMADAAKTLSLDYDFCALPVEQALKEADRFAAVLLAPQVAHLRARMRKEHPHTVVFEIPAKVFGSYDAGGALRLLLHALHDAQDAGLPEATLSAVSDFSDNRRVLIITLFVMRDHSRIGYRLYERGVGKAEGTVRKPLLDFRDVDDLIDTLILHDIDIKTLDAVGVAVPGVTYRGTITLPNVLDKSHELGVHLSQRLKMPVFVDNNCNAAAVGCYVSQNEVENLVFYRHAFGHDAGGLGTVIDGQLLKGRRNLAGEPKYFESSFSLSTSYDEALWSANGLHELAFNVIATTMSLIAPDAVYIAVDTVDDADEFKGMLRDVFEDEYIPEVHIVRDYVERVYLGELALTLQKLRDPTYRSLGVT